MTRPALLLLAAALLSVLFTACGKKPEEPAPPPAATQARNLVADAPAAATSSVRLRVSGQGEQTLYAQGSYALVIGASRYTNGWSVLPGVPDDVQAVTRLLKAQGFGWVQTVMNPTRAELDKALRDFLAQYGSQPEARVLVYFAGHGYTLTSGAGVKLGYIVPVDAPIPSQNPGGFRSLAYSMATLRDLATQMEAKHALFIFDSCFAGSIFKTATRGEGTPPHIGSYVSQPVRQFITSGGEEEVPDYSIFRRQLEQAFDQRAADLDGDGYITGTELGMYLQKAVINAPGSHQTPQWGKLNIDELARGDFVFALPTVAAAPTPPATPSSGSTTADADTEAWEQAKRIGSPAAYQAYLDNFPQGRYVGSARVGLTTGRQHTQYTGEKLSMNFQNIGVRELLQILSDLANVNMVVDKDVKGQVSLKLKDIPWDQALDIVAEQAALEIKRSGNVIYVDVRR